MTDPDDINITPAQPPATPYLDALWRAIESVTTHVVVHPDNEQAIRDALADRPLIEVHASPGVEPGKALTWTGHPGRTW